MKNLKKDNSVNIKDLNNLAARLEKNIDSKLDNKLCKFTEDVLLPSIKRIVKSEMDDAIGKHRNEMKNYE